MPDLARHVTMDAGLIAASLGSAVLTHRYMTHWPDAWRTNVTSVGATIWYVVVLAACVGHALRKQTVTLATTLLVCFAMLLCFVVLVMSAPTVDPPSDEPVNQRPITFDMAK